MVDVACRSRFGFRSAPRDDLTAYRADAKRQFSVSRERRFTLMIKFNEPLYPQNPCPGCERGEVLEDLPGLSELRSPLPPEKIHLNQTAQIRVHLPSNTHCLKFLPLDLVKANPNARLLRNAAGHVQRRTAGTMTVREVNPATERVASVMRIFLVLLLLTWAVFCGSRALKLGAARRRQQKLIPPQTNLR
jgi:hypothetical protein